MLRRCRALCPCCRAPPGVDTRELPGVQTPHLAQHAVAPGYSSSPPEPFQKIGDRFETLEEVSQALRNAGLEACQLIVGVDFTKSNEWNGERSFGGESLHSIRDRVSNPYQTALSLIARTLSDFDSDHLIPAYGFGDVTTRESAVFSFYPNNLPASGLQSLLERYRQIAMMADLSGPTSFAPLIQQAMRHVYHNRMQFHVLLILADGQISAGCLPETVQAIYEASFFPISIIMIGVGDGPWDAMQQFDNALPQRRWDNFQFVEHNRIMGNANVPWKVREARFALNALMEVPEQYRLAQGMMGVAAQANVQNIVARIPAAVMIDPPRQFS